MIRNIFEIIFDHYNFQDESIVSVPLDKAHRVVARTRIGSFEQVLKRMATEVLLIRYWYGENLEKGKY